MSELLLQDNNQQSLRSEHWAGDFETFLTARPSRLSSREETKLHPTLGTNF